MLLFVLLHACAALRGAAGRRWRSRSGGAGTSSAFHFLASPFPLAACLDLPSSTNRNHPHCGSCPSWRLHKCSIDRQNALAGHPPVWISPNESRNVAEPASIFFCLAGCAAWKLWPSDVSSFSAMHRTNTGQTRVGQHISPPHPCPNRSHTPWTILKPAIGLGIWHRQW